MKTFDPETSGPLKDVRVLDLSRLVAGNMLSAYLADFGADVIKVEREGVGDDLRSWREQGHDIYWKVWPNRNSSNGANRCWTHFNTNGRAILCWQGTRKQAV